jgi:hypothetical protein
LAMRSWPSLGPPSPTRTTLSGRCGPAFGSPRQSRSWDPGIPRCCGPPVVLGR